MPDMYQAMPSLVLMLAWLLLLHMARGASYWLALLTWPGTIGHELLHAIVGGLLQAQPVKMSIFPRRVGSTLVLGSVTFENINLWNGAPAAFAPLLLVGVAWLVWLYWTLPSYQAGMYYHWLFSSYIAASCLRSSLPSSTDVRLGLTSLVLYGALGFGLWHTFGTGPVPLLYQLGP